MPSGVYKRKPKESQAIVGSILSDNSEHRKRFIIVRSSKLDDYRESYEKWQRSDKQEKWKGPEKDKGEK